MPTSFLTHVDIEFLDALASLRSILFTYILKAKKLAEPPFQSKKIAEKRVNPGIIFGPFGVILGHLGHYWAILDHFGSF